MGNAKRTWQLNKRNLQRISAEVLRDTRADSLGLFQNALTELPDELWTLTALRLLNRGDNKIARLPDAVGNLANLRMLDLGHNLLTAVPDAIGRSGGIVRPFEPEPQPAHCVA